MMQTRHANQASGVKLSDMHGTDKNVNPNFKNRKASSKHYIHKFLWSQKFSLKFNLELFKAEM